MVWEAVVLLNCVRVLGFKLFGARDKEVVIVLFRGFTFM